MELGAIVCTPRQPKCEACPVRKWCATQGEAPRITAPQAQKKKEVWCVLDQRNDRIRLVQRPNQASLMAGMWELPQLTAGQRQSSTAAARRRKNAAHGASRGSVAPNSKAPKGRKKAPIVPWNTFRHSITVTDYTVHVIRGAASAREGQWIPISNIGDLPITGLTRKILRAAKVI